jgi:hypothetical protein
MAHHPSLRGRRIVALGTYGEAVAWAERTHIDVHGILVASTVRQIADLPAPQLHIVVLSSVRNWRNPYHFILRTELHHLHSQGATVEWA